MSVERFKFFLQNHRFDDMNTRDERKAEDKLAPIRELLEGQAAGSSSSSMETTAEVVEFFDELFDSVNCYPGGTTKGKLREAVKMNSPHVQFGQKPLKN
ncbi:unnamed protein product [Euphydryas editha]|uniref:Uncharacterized protein n=1 Tax=Euphydryas editha TaxID=104508 RepID=A0AAU9TNR9_EUPED|nr:unnamed protein product [Euphydryas editha]